MDAVTGAQQAGPDCEQVGLELLLDACASLASQQNGVPLVQQLTLLNKLGDVLLDVLVRLTPEPAFAAPLELRVARIAGGSRQVWEAPKLSLSTGFLLGLNERLDAQLRLEVVVSGTKVLERRAAVALLAYDQWGGLCTLPELLAAFVLPNHPAVAATLRQAALLLEHWTGSPALDGYQSGSRERVRSIAAALYHAFQEAGISYAEPPASFERDGQKVRTPDRIAQERLATCLDMALFAAAALEQAGLNALLVVVQGHAFVGVWLRERQLAEACLDDHALLEKLVGLGEVLLFDPSAALQRPVRDFANSCAAAKEQLRRPQEFGCALDVAKARAAGVRPLPLRAQGVELDRTTDLERSRAPSLEPQVPLPREPGAQRTNMPHTRIETWMRRLLDLTNRNRLLNTRATKKTVPLLDEDLGALEDLFSSGRSLVLRPLPATDPERSRQIESEDLRAMRASERRSGRLATALPAQELEERMVNIYRAARNELEESGASGFYLALGFLEWFEGEQEQGWRAPLVLLPVRIERPSVAQGIQLAYSGEEPRFNTTLLEMLRQKHGLEIPGVEPLPEGERGIDLETVLQRVRTAVRDVPRWRVLEQAWLGFFKFAKFEMWENLQRHADRLQQAPLLRHLVEHPEAVFDPGWAQFETQDLESSYSSAELPCPVSADSSQLLALLAAAQGHSFVLEGPPGTGKSQTISNLIAGHLARGKSVLFVSEKAAALNVVFERLKAIGLQRFCLELHSDKADKKQVIEQLGQALSGAREPEPGEWAAQAQAYDRARAELNHYVRALHREQANGLSVYRATTLLTELRTLPVVDLGWPLARAADAASLAQLHSSLREAQHALERVGAPQGHALAGVGLQQAGAAEVARVRGAAQQLQAAIAAARQVLPGLSQGLGVELEQASLRELQWLAASAAALRQAPPFTAALLGARRESSVRELQAACALGRERALRRAELATQADLGILGLDLLALCGRARAAQSSWAVPRWFQTRALRRELLAVSPHAGRRSLEELAALVERASACVKLDERLLTSLAAASAHLDTSLPLDAPWDALEASLACSESLRQQAQDLFADPQAAQLRVAALAALARGTPPAELEARAAATEPALQALFEAASLASASLQLDPQDEWFAPGQSNRLSSWSQRLQRIESALDGLKLWALWRRLRARLLEQRAGALVQAVESGSLRSSELVLCFERSYLERWLEEARAAEPVLRDFLALAHEQRIARFVELDERCQQLARMFVVARLAAAVPRASNAAVPGSELAILKRQLELQRKHLPPRQLLLQTRGIVQQLKPCFLMSPASVAKFLDPTGLVFDLIVFDEASQMPTWDAAGAIGRARQAVVVGDSKQLPPTSFFEVVLEQGEEQSEAVEELESILDECRAANLPTLDLRWHYRSRHESLITFSNRRYYDNRLCTFPAARWVGLGVQWRHVPEGVYAKSRSRTNRLEAEALVAELLARLRDPARQDFSLGVVTFSLAQQQLVENLLDDARRADGGLERFFHSTPERPEPVFVKNLENVQGDERDVILFSICYGPDESGAVSMNFGPLNQAGGERRLNVAVTRARRELLVFSTLTSEHIDLARTRARGVVDLKAFLAYAQHGAEALPALVAVAGEPLGESTPLELEIARALRSKGYQVHTRVGCSGYRVDLAVLHPEQPGSYLLGIECDGENYASAHSARDRDRLRPSVLRALGWQLARVWSSEWLSAPELELARLCSLLEAVRAGAKPGLESAPRPGNPAAASTSAASPAPAAVAPAQEPAAALRSAASRAVPRARRLGTQAELREPHQRKRVLAELEALVEAQGPLLLESATSQLVQSFGFERRNPQLVEFVDALGNELGLERSVHGARIFLWPRTKRARDWRGSRPVMPGEAAPREVEELPPEELANAAEELLRNSGAAPRLELLRALGRRFGLASLGRNAQTCLAEGLELLLVQGRARRDGPERIALP